MINEIRGVTSVEVTPPILLMIHVKQNTSANHELVSMTRIVTLSVCLR